LGFMVLRPERGPATLPRRFGRLGGMSLWVIVPGLLYFGTPALAEAFRKAAATGPYMMTFFALFALTAVLTFEEFLVPWSLFPRSARIERSLIGVLSASLMLLLALAVGKLAGERWLEGDSDGATVCFLLLVPLAVMFFVYLARTRAFAPSSTSSLVPAPPGNRLKVRQDGETVTIQLPGPRLLPRNRIQIREGYVRRAGTFAGVRWGRRLPVSGRPPNLTRAEQAWLRSLLGHDPIASVDSLMSGLKLELQPQPLFHSDGRVRVELLLQHNARCPWSLSDLEQAAGGIVWRAAVNGREADVTFSHKERETAIPPRRAVELHPRIYLHEPAPPGTPLEVAITCRGGESAIASAPVVLEG